MLQLAEVPEVGAIGVALGVEEVHIAQVQVLEVHKLGNDKRVEIELTFWHEREASEIAKGLEVLEGLVDITGVEIWAVVYIG